MADQRVSKDDPINWPAVFDMRETRPPATTEEIAGLTKSLARPVSRQELAAIRKTESNPFPASDPLHGQWRPIDPSRWVWPIDRPLPPSYVSFLRYSNGGYFETGKRVFQMEGTRIRELMLGYLTPEFAPLAVPFALNGGGVFHFFDMRGPPNSAGEYPVLCASAGSLDFSAPKVADSFFEACCGRFNVERLIHSRVLSADEWKVFADPSPMLDDCEDDARRLRLFACACARQVAKELPPGPFGEAIELAERLADGLVSDEARSELKKRCRAHRVRTDATDSATSCLDSNPGAAATNAAFRAALVQAGGYESDAWASVRSRQAELLREIFLNPLAAKPRRPQLPQPVVAAAERLYQLRNFDDGLPALRKMLEGPEDSLPLIVEHLSKGEHVRGCWAVDLLRGVD